MDNARFSENNRDLSLKIQNKLALQLIEINESFGDLEIRIAAKDILAVVNILKADAELKFNMLVSLTAIDFMDSDFFPRPVNDRYDAVYHFLSIDFKYRLRIVAALPEADPRIDSLTALYHSANFMEREAWDMYGISFQGHPDLRKILMYEEFKGHPLRKDYPVQGKQPRVAMRFPEVENTARDMRRAELVQIRNKKTLGVING